VLSTLAKAVDIVEKREAGSRNTENHQNSQNLLNVDLDTSDPSKKCGATIGITI